MSESNMPIIVVCSEGAKTTNEIIQSLFSQLFFFFFYHYQNNVTNSSIVNIHTYIPHFHSDLRKESVEQNTIKLCDNITGYRFHNVTKYYENDIAFLSHESNHVNLIPAELLERIEGLIIYFDSENVSKQLSKCCVSNIDPPSNLICT